MKPLTYLAAVPLLLLVACGDSTDADSLDPEPMPTPDIANVDEVELTPTTLDEAGDFTGTYSLQSDSGETRTLRLDAIDDSYEYVGPDGSPQTGYYSRTDDAYRLLIEDFEDRPGYFVFVDGDLYQMQGEEISREFLTVADRYVRVENAAPSADVPNADGEPPEAEDN